MYRQLKQVSESKRHRILLEAHSQKEKVPKEAVPWSLISSYVDKHPHLKDELDAFVKHRVLKEPMRMDSTLSADVCETCGVSMMVIANDSMLACSRCAKTRVITSANAWTSSMDADFSTLHATQKSRVLEWLELVQAKESGDIDEGLLRAVCQYLVDTKQTPLADKAVLSIIREDYLEKGPYTDVLQALQRLGPKLARLEQNVNLETVLKQLDHVVIRNVLKVVPYADARKQSERSAKIASLLSGYYPERLTANQEEYIRKLFLTATPVYNRFRKSAQPNWPSGYPYFLRCLLILLGWDEIAAHFPNTLANRNAEREEQRREIWKILRWDFCPSHGPLSSVTLPNGTFLTGQHLQDVDSRSK